MKHSAIAALFAGALLVLPAVQAQESEHKLKDFELGDVVAGDKEVHKDTKGKVVVLEFWGTR